MSDLSKEARILIYFMPFYILITVGAFLLNLYIIVIILMNKKMHISVNFFIASACVSSLLMSIFSLPFEIVLLFENFYWNLGFTLCKIWYILDFTTCTSSFLFLISITFIRYKSIVSPHDEWASKKIQIVIFCLIWVVPITIWSVIFSKFLNDNSENSKCLLKMKHNIDDISVSFLFLLPLFILVAINIKLILELRKRSKKIFNKQLINTSNAKKQENSRINTQPKNLEVNPKSKFQNLLPS